MNSGNIPIGRLMAMASNMMRRIMEKKFSELPCSAVEAMTISFINNALEVNPDSQVFQRDIEREFYLRPSTVSEIIKNLEQKGFIYRENVDGDGRKKKLVLTEVALEYDKASKIKLSEIDNMLTKNISIEDLEIYRKILNNMIENLKD